MDRQVKAQLRASSGRSSKVIKDRERLEAIVEVAVAGTLVLEVEAGGGYSLRAYPEGGDQGDQNRGLVAVGVVRSDGIVALRPGADGADGGGQGDLGRDLRRTPDS
jgi:hypothetical protein